MQTKCDLANSTGELASLHASLKESSAVLAITTELLEMDAAVKNIDDACKDKRFLDASKSLHKLRVCRDDFLLLLTILILHLLVPISLGYNGALKTSNTDCFHFLILGVVEQCLQRNSTARYV